MKKRMIMLNTALVLGLGSLIPSYAGAESIHDMEKEKKGIQEKRSGVQSGIKDADKKINQLQGQQETLDEKIHRLETAIYDSEQKIKEKNIQIKETKQEIEKLRAEIIELKDRIAKRDAILKDRAVSLQEAGGQVSYLEVLLGSSSFSNFISRMGAVTTIVEADQEILKQHEQDKKDLEEKQASVENKLANLEAMKSDLEAMKQQLTSQKKEQKRLLSKLKKKEKDTHEMKMSLKEEEANLAAQEKAVKQAINLEKTRLAELKAARKRAAEEAAKRAAEAKRQAAEAAKQKQKQQQSSSNDRSSSPSPSPSPSVAPPAVSSGMFTNPSAGRVTSAMGPRWNKNHAGIDIAQAGTVPIVAAADGVVIRSYMSSTYGNCVMVSHNLNGQTYTTVYAHMRSRNVSNGQVVAKGQQVGLMGNTGRSYGQHLHFEIHKGAWNIGKTNAVNPLNYVSY